MKKIKKVQKVKKAEKVAVIVDDKPCQCETHVREEAKEPNKPWIPCLGHGKGCPCTALIETNASEPIVTAPTE